MLDDHGALDGVYDINEPDNDEPPVQYAVEPDIAVVLRPKIYLKQCVYERTMFAPAEAEVRDDGYWFSDETFSIENSIIFVPHSNIAFVAFAQDA